MAIRERPNIVFVLTDDQGYGELGCHGNPVIRTPNMDALYRESIRLTDYHVGPTCAPTRAGLMTGHYHNSTGVWHTIGGRSLLRKDEWSLATALSEAGYVTGLFGKWHLGDNYPYRPQDRGFQYVVAHGGGGVGQTNDYWGNNYHDDTYAVNGSWQPFEGYCTDVWFNEALAFIERNRDRPFFCYLSTNAPHSPYIVDASYSDPYVGKVEHEERARFYGMITKIDEDLGLLRHQLAAGSGGGEEISTEVGGVKVLCKRVPEMEISELRNLADSLRQSLGSGVLVLGMESGGKATLLAAVTEDLTGRIPAGVLVKKLAPLVGGRGGGRPNLAQAGGPDAAGIPGALRRVPELVEELLGTSG